MDVRTVYRAALMFKKSQLWVGKDVTNNVSDLGAWGAAKRTRVEYEINLREIFSSARSNTLRGGEYDARSNQCSGTRLGKNRSTLSIKSSYRHNVFAKVVGGLNVFAAVHCISG